MGEIVKKEGKLFYRKTVKAADGTTEESSGQKDVSFEEVLDVPTASAGCSRGIKISRNYQSADVSCWVTLPCKDDPKEVEKTLSEASELVDDFLGKVLVPQAADDLKKITK